MARKLSMGMLMATGLLLLFAASSAAAVVTHNFELQSGDTRSFKSEHPLRKVVIGDPDVVYVEVTGKQEIYLVGRKIGQTKITLRGETLLQATVLDILVTPDVTNLKRRISELFPDQDIKIYSNYNGIILTGTVTGAEIVEQVLRLTQQILSAPAEVSGPAIKISDSVRAAASRQELADIVAAAQNIAPQQGGGGGGGKGSATATGTSGPSIVNLLKVGGPQQVLLEVKFAEVNRTSARELQAGFSLSGLGSDFKAGIGTGAGSAVGAIAGATGNLISNIPLLPNVFVSIDNFALYMKFLEEERLGRILAEPKLVTMSGQEASFLAGGEFPYQTVDDNDVNTEFKEFGIGLRFTPIVGSDGMITLKVSPSVTDITDQTVDFGTGKLPILVTRKLDSTVQLRDGQTLALAGLLQDSLIETVEKVPFLGDLPILGALFRSTDYLKKKTDLLIAVTPHLVKPVPEGQISYPGEFVKPPNRFEFYLEGRLEGRRSPNDLSALSEHSFTMSSAAGGGLEGQFGHTEAK